MAGRKRGRPKKMSTANPERKPKKSQTALDLLHAQATPQTAAPSPQGEPAVGGPLGHAVGQCRRPLGSLPWCGEWGPSPVR